MPRDPLILGFDTSAAHCAAALLSGDQIIAGTVEEMKRGQAERLMPLLEEVLASANADWRDLTKVGVGIGPGNFTGIRIAVSAARGLGMGLGVPAIGVSQFQTTQLLSGSNRIAVPAPRDQAYVFDTGEMARPALVSAIQGDWATATLSTQFKVETHVGAIAKIALSAPQDAPPPKPLYVRSADAAPPSDPPPVIVP